MRRIAFIILIVAASFVGPSAGKPPELPAIPSAEWRVPLFPLGDEFRERVPPPEMPLPAAPKPPIVPAQIWRWLLSGIELCQPLLPAQRF